MSAAEQPLLRVDDLELAYEASGTAFWQRRLITAVTGVTFDIRAGETLGLVGESGSGKSTTGKAILRQMPIAGGSIEFDGKSIDEWGSRTPLSYRRDVQAVFQDPSTSLNPRHLNGQTMETTLRRHGVTSRAEVRKRSQEAFDLVGLSADHLNRFPNELSGGQQQRVAIARAIVLKPRLIVCDEAVSALDMSTQGQIINLFDDLQQETGVAYLFIAHDLGLVRHISDRVGVMEQGRLVELSETNVLFDNPQHEYTQRLLAATPAVHPAGREERRARRQAARATA